MPLLCLVWGGHPRSSPLLSTDPHSLPLLAMSTPHSCLQMDAIGYVLGKQDFFAYKKRYGFRDSKVSGFSFTLWPKKRVALRTYVRGG